MIRTLTLPLVLLLATLASAEWNAAAMKTASTLELRTAAPGEEPHWSTVWMVVVDGQVYVRLGRRAAWRADTNVEKPWVAVRFAGEEFARVKLEPAPDMKGRVNDAMADKYWSDVFIGWFGHPLTARLVPESGPGEPTP